MRIGSLFSGIGGLELGLEAAIPGAHTLWQCELDPHCRAVLAHHWPSATRYTDVTRLQPSALAPVDILCGGFPCQDVSLAGEGAGLEGQRSGLWFEYLRIIEALRPRYVVIENVLGLVRRGLDVVVGGLEHLNYTVEGTRIRAGDVGAPHRRERVFILAYAHREGQPQQGGAIRQERGRAGDSGESLADTHRPGLEEQQHGEARELSPPLRAHAGSAESGVVRPADGVPGWLDQARWPLGQGEAQHEWEAARTVAPRSVPRRTQRIKMLGNSVVPQCAYIVGRRITQHLEPA